jgi:hypothetical protein
MRIAPLSTWSPGRHAEGSRDQPQVVYSEFYPQIFTDSNDERRPREASMNIFFICG